jgi:hypothetical protein
VASRHESGAVTLDSCRMTISETKLRIKDVLSLLGRIPGDCQSSPSGAEDDGGGMVSAAITSFNLTTPAS